MKPDLDLALIGAGAAGLAAAIFVKRRRPEWRVVAFDGAATLGAKLLVCGGGRCNLSNARVTEEDFSGGKRTVVRNVLRAFPVEATLTFFAELGVVAQAEESGKLFPRSNRARTVLDALLRELRSRGVEVRTSARVRGLTRQADGYRLRVNQETVSARRVLLATGGMSLPRSGSDGAGYALARSLGHGIVDPAPALVPLNLEGAFHRALSGVSVPVELTLSAKRARAVRSVGPLLFTHFGISGPAVLDISRHWIRASREGREPQLTANLAPGEDFAALEAWLLDRAAARPRCLLATCLGERLPATVVGAILRALDLDPAQVRLAGLARATRRRLVEALLAWPLPVHGQRGFAEAEVTAGGVPLSEVKGGTLESTLSPGLFFAGEILDVDGRLGGFNLQWAWSSGWVAARGIAASGGE
jgi:predicted Rossmann fold flavoprotein